MENHRLIFIAHSAMPAVTRGSKRGFALRSGGVWGGAPLNKEAS